MENKLPQSNQQPKKTRWVTFPFLTHITLLLPMRCILVRPKHWIMKVSSDPSITARYCLPQWQPTSCKSLCSLIYLFCASSSNCCMKVVCTAKYLLPKTEAFTQANRIFSSSQQRAIFQSPLAGLLVDGLTQEKNILAAQVFQWIGARFLPCVAQKMGTEAEVTSLLFIQLLLRCRLHAETTQK